MNSERPVFPPPGRLTVIAEAGVNHDGDEGRAHELIDVAVRSGADAVKFQTFDPALLVSSHAQTTPYQRDRAGAEDQAGLLAALTLPTEAWARLRDHAEGEGLTFLSTPFDLGSARLLAGLGVAAIKTSSGELTNTPFLQALAELGLPLLVSTGMGDEDEVAAALRATSAAPSVTLLHCVSAYPAPIEEANLRVIPALAAEHGVPVGWSDHTRGLTSAVVAVALGATVLEKHMTTDRTLPGPDHAASLEPGELRDYVTAVRDAAASLGDGVKRRMPSEVENAALVRRSWHAARDLPAGHTVVAADAVTLRPEHGLAPATPVIGARVVRPVRAGDPITATDVELA
ncbi:N-acetylneuraminate synthase family protein [Nocardioides sp. URHA0020]|uniref:N-acetylneuraminate synthase family protein n=1 Tax=Nocardioides sp. URHA0020 TaxID=1380392 RepID=UPI00048D6C63|nr:N-acetylneuraminate synthase family protein [Nocardioides sp. URHA0020]